MVLPTFLPGTVQTVEAPAKINLSLHVVGRRPDGFHRLDGIVAFARIGDRLSIADAPKDRLELVGPMAVGLRAVDNILIKTLAVARAVAERDGVRIRGMALTLDKRLPIAAGIGGGSADAASLLRVLVREHSALKDALLAQAPLLGADVPMCFHSKPARISGIGEIVEHLPALPPMPMVLVNPGIEVPTPVVFARLQNPDGARPPPLPAEGFAGFEAVASYLDHCRNDLEAPAFAVAPPINEAMAALRATNARIVRMSGSGATVFALFETDRAAAEAASIVARAHPGWWVVPTRIRGSEEMAA